MGLLTNEIEIGIGGSTIKWYENIGYTIPKYKNKKGEYKIHLGTKIKVKPEHLPKGSGAKVDVKCDNCGKILRNIGWQGYKNCVKDDGKYYCKKCSSKLYGNENQRIARLKNGKSFEQWCIENNRQDILDRWDYKLNDCKPHEIAYTSLGFNKKGYYFKCQNGIHPSEIFNLGTLTSKVNNELNCRKCNSFGFIYPNLVKYLKYKNDAIEKSYGSGKKVITICPNCGFEKNMPIRELWSKGFSCSKCGDGISYPEKFLFNLLQQLNISFISQLTRTTFKWCNDYKYDFYIPYLNCIIETHGLQHYNDLMGSWRTKTIEKQQENDKLKEKIAKENGIIKYIVIDCRYSNFEFVKNNILNSELNQILDLENVDFLKCHEFACNSRVKEVADLWNSGIHSTIEIGRIMKLHYTTVSRYLKQAKRLSWCDYDAKLQTKRNKGIPVICLNTNEVFNCIADACENYNLFDNNIIVSCKNKKRSAGKHPGTGEKLRWMYYEDYIKQQENSKVS